MSKKSEKSFTLTEILIVTSVIAIVAGFVFLAMGGARTRSRDSKRVAEVDTLRMALEYYYYDYGEYPESPDWLKIEEDEDIGGPFSQAMKDPRYLPQIPRDSLYGKTTESGDPYSYQYKSTKDKSGYKIHVELEGGDPYEVFSEGGGGIVYYGGGVSGWYNPDWGCRKKITIDHTKVSATLTNFPVLFSRTDIDLKAHAKSDGSDILFTNSGGTKLKREIEKYNGSTGELVAWVRIPSLSSTIDTEVYIYYGNAGGAETNDFDVWDNDFKMVHHLQEICTHYDSTSNYNNGVIRGGINPYATGQINGGDDLDGEIGTFIEIANDSSLNNLQIFTLEGWIKPFYSANTAGWGPAFLQRETGSRVNLIIFRAGIDSGGAIITCEWPPSWWEIDYSFEEGQWYYIVCQASETKKIIYVNGEFASNTDRVDDPDYSNPARLFIGQDQDGANPSDFFNGTIDEVRISGSVRSADWIKTCYNNQKDPDSFAIFGPEE